MSGYKKGILLLVFSCLCIFMVPAYAYQKITDGYVVAYIPENDDEKTFLPMNLQKEIEDGAQLQQTGGKQPGDYNPDAYQVILLVKGTVVYGMIGYQSNYYTDKQTYDAAIAKCDLKKLNYMLQIGPHNGTVRTGVAKYQLKQDMYVAKGICSANPKFGQGGGVQYLVPLTVAQMELFDRNNNSINLSGSYVEQ